MTRARYFINNTISSHLYVPPVSSAGDDLHYLAANETEYKLYSYPCTLTKLLLLARNDLMKMSIYRMMVEINDILSNSQITISCYF